MKETIQKIREELHIDQEQFASLLGISPSTIKHWESGVEKPDIGMQSQLYELCRMSQIDLTDYLIGREYTIGNGQILYHASRKGIEGMIRPISRARCDFGKGFYMGTDPLQPLTLVCNEDNPVFYTVDLDMSGLRILDIEVGLEWAMLIAYYRGYMEGHEHTELYKKYAHMADNYDLICGFIANDRMYQVLTDFFEMRIMDTALIASLSALQLGRQYVAISQRACDQIKIIKTRKLDKLDLMFLIAKSEMRRKEGKALADRMVMLHRRDGLFFDEILNGAKK